MSLALFLALWLSGFLALWIQPWLSGSGSGSRSSSLALWLSGSLALSLDPAQALAPIILSQVRRRKVEELLGAELLREPEVWGELVALLHKFRDTKTQT